MELITNTIPEDRLMAPSEVKFKKKGHCIRHKKQCCFDLSKRSDTMGVLGAPCQLFSKRLRLTFQT